MLVEVTGWTYSDSDRIESIASEIGIDDSKHFLCLYGTRNSTSLLREKIRQAEKKSKRIYRIHTAIDCGLVLPLVALKDFEKVGLIHTRYIKKDVRDKLISILKDGASLSSSESIGMNLDLILSSKTEERVELLKKAFPHIRLLVFQFQNLNYSIKKNSIGIVLDNKCIVQSETKIIGWNEELPQPKLEFN